MLAWIEGPLPRFTLDRAQVNAVVVRFEPLNLAIRERWPARQARIEPITLVL